MASPLLSRSPQCMTCIRRTASSLGEKHMFPAGQQIRGKKKLAKQPNRVNALLLKDIKRYGKKGSVLSINPGIMRNLWFPRRLAEYVTAARMQELGLKKDDIIDPVIFRAPEEIAVKKAVIKRADVMEAAEAKVETEAVEETQNPVLGPVIPVEFESLTPEQATRIMADLLPPQLEFFRAPIITEQAPPKRISPSITAKAAISAEASKGKEPQKTSIQGSVSTHDIATNITAVLAEDERGARIILSPEDISFVEKTKETGHVEHIGTFGIDIRLKGAPNAVRRTIKVTAQN
ncbi:hypothetical protein G7Y89_g8832 [Cudoniella acicularis]|uniref:Ribosomal protein L9 domain-containing protein n=1 Tax=Cudoniella acicularis TaxID=354080 RepID=A0A8H4RFU8_9HELO|nr:hypothetical protein G7Y89_g8832 [Cudoniella acicularis]